MNAPVAIAVFSEFNLVCEMANNAYLSLMGKKLNDFVGKPLFESFPETKDLLQPILADLLQIGNPFTSTEFEIKLKRNGRNEVCYFNSVWEPFREESGLISGVIVATHEVTEQVIGRRKAEQSAAQFRIVLESDDLGTFDYYPQTNDLIWSAKTKELFGLPYVAEVYYETYLNALHPDDKEKAHADFQKALQKEHTGFYENEYRTMGFTDGKQRWLRSKGKVEFDAENKAIHFTGITQDITHQKEILASLQIQSLVLQSMDEGVSVSDENGYIILTNQAEDKMFGYEPGELLGKQVTIQNAYDEFENERIVTGVIKELKAKGFWSGEWHNRKKDGTNFYTYSYITAVSVEGKTLFVCVQRDITKEKHYRDALVESEDNFRTLADSIPQLSWMTDEKGGIYWYNQRWYEYTGTTLKEMQGWGWQDVHHPDMVEGVTKRFKKSIENGTPWEDTFLLKGKDGDYKWFLSRAVPIYNDKGHIIKWFGTNTDISEQRKTGQALKEAKEQLELTFQNTPTSIYLFGKNGEILFANNNAALLMGYESAQELLAEKDFAVLKKTASQSFEILTEYRKPFPLNESPTSITLRSGKAAEAILLFLKKSDNSEMWVLTKSSAIFDLNGELSMVLTASTDITAQKTAEEKIRFSEQRFRTLAETIPQLVWITNEKGEQEYASNRWKEYSGLEPRGADTWERLVHPDDMGIIAKAWLNSISTGEMYKSEVRLKSKTGEYRWHHVQGEPIRDEGGTIIKWIGAFTDIHDQKTLSERLEALVQERTMELQRSNDDLQQFAHVASHDLKEPVRKIKTFTSRLHDFSEAALTDVDKFYIQKVQGAADRMSSMIEGVLAYSTINGSGHYTESISLNDIIKNIEADLEIVIQEKNAVIRYKNLPIIEGASVLIYQLFYNLINNSLKFTKPNETSVVFIESKVILYSGEEAAKIVVKDNGIGFEPQYNERIFNTFTRLHSKDQYEGTGLGLALCKKIVQRHGGTIHASGELNKGATFTIILPFKQVRQDGIIKI